MSDLLKVVTFAIKVPEKVNTMRNKSYYSNLFTMKAKDCSDESTWKLECVFKGTFHHNVLGFYQYDTLN